MKGSIINYKGMWCRLWEPLIPSDIDVVIVQGSGEFTTKTDGSDLPLFIDRNSYANYAKAGVEFPFNIIVAASYRTPGATGNPSMITLKKYLSEFIASRGKKTKILMGYSFGGEFTAGMVLASRNSGQLTTSYLGGDIWDGWVIMCGRPPGTCDYGAYNKELIVIHGEVDGRVAFSNGKKLYTNKLASPNQTCHVSLYPITGGDHASSWIQGFDQRTNIGNAVMNWIKSFLVLQPVQCQALLDEVGMTAEFLLPDGVVRKYSLSSWME